MVVTREGITIDVRPENINAFPPMVASCDPATKVTDVNDTVLSNAPFPMVVTPEGIEIDVIAVLENAASPMVVSNDPAKVTDVNEAVI